MLAPRTCNRLHTPDGGGVHRPHGVSPRESIGSSVSGVIDIRIKKMRFQTFDYSSHKDLTGSKIAALCRDFGPEEWVPRHGGRNGN